MRKFSDCNYPEDYNNLQDDDKATMALWINNRIALVAKALRPENRLNSYGLKHRMERETGLYVTNGQFKGGMKAAGYEAFDTDNINWTYQVGIIKEQNT